MLYKYVKKEVRPKIKIRTPKEKTFSKENFLKASITLSCFLLGLGILGYSFFPYLSNYAESLNGNNISKTLLSPSQNGSSGGKSVLGAQSYQLSSGYISNVSKSITAANQGLHIDPKTFPELANITGMMKLSIKKLNIKNIPVRVNVDSFDEKSYMPLLDKSLAHFKGTSLPDKEGNTFVYGHSANELWAKTDPSNPKYALSFLNKMDIGDEITIEYNGQTYTYRTQKVIMVEPNDISPIYSTSSEKILTLMTCYPPGIGSQRLILISKQVLS